MSKPQNLEIIMQLIIDSSNAKNQTYEAIKLAKEGAFDPAQRKIELAEESFLKAHRMQSELLAHESAGESLEVSLLLVHGQDHLMTSMLFNDIAKELIELYQRIA